MSTNKFTVALVALFVAATLAGCSTGPSPDTNAASASSSVAAAPTLPDVHRISDKVDRATAEAALAAGVPFIFGIPDGPEPACHTALLLPGGEAWFLNKIGSAPVAGAALDRSLKEYGCTDLGGTETPGGPTTPVTPLTPTTAAGPTVPDLAWLSTRVDLSAAQRAMREGKPFIFGIPDGGVPACHTGLLLPDGAVWVMNRSGAAPVEGIALDLDDLKQYGCRAGTPNPGGN